MDKPSIATKLADRVRQDLETEILTGELAPGARLDETRLAERFEVSRTPIREALTQLASVGLVETRPRQGAIVARITPKRLAEMFEVMAEIEGLCARLAARRMTAAELERLKALHVACNEPRTKGEPDEYYDLNLAFHDAIFEGSHNSFLVEQARYMRARTQPFRRLQLHRMGRMDRSFEEHNAVVEAILAGDEARAEALLKAHVSIQGDVFTELITSLPADEPASRSA